MKFYDIGESPLMGHSEKHIAPLLFCGSLLLSTAIAKGNESVATSNASAKPAQSVAQLLSSASGLVNQTVVVSGIVDHVC